jgi:hypothetical protein
MARHRPCFPFCYLVRRDSVESNFNTGGVRVLSNPGFIRPFRDDSGLDGVSPHLCLTPGVPMPTTRTRQVLFMINAFVRAKFSGALSDTTNYSSELFDVRSVR